MPTDEGAYAIGDLAGLAGTTPRTVRYYVAQGLLPAPVGSGPGARYTDGHLARLRLIRRLQRQHQPLSEIRQRLASLGDEDVRLLLANDAAPDAAPGDSALDYIRSILGSPAPREVSPLVSAPPVPVPSEPPAPTTTTSPVSRSVRAAPGALAAPARLLRELAMPRMRDLPPVALQATAATAGAQEDASAEQRSQWDRVGITPNIEIHVRRPLSRLENRRVERLITIARQVLREEQP